MRKQHPENEPCSQFTNIQIRLDNSILEKNVFRNDEVFSFKDFFALLNSNIRRDELVSLENELHNEYSQRTSMIVEMIPDEVWMTIFDMLLDFEKRDVSQVLPLKQVCKRWSLTFPDSFPNVLIPERRNHHNTLCGINQLRTLRSLTIKDEAYLNQSFFHNSLTKLDTLVLEYPHISIGVSPSAWTLLTNLTTLTIACFETLFDSFIINHRNLKFLTNLQHLSLGNMHALKEKSLKKLVHLKTLNIRMDYYDLSPLEFSKKYGHNLELLDHLKGLEKMTLKRYSFLSCRAVQLKYPHVRFRWHLINEEKTDEIGMYEGSFGENNKAEGFGRIDYHETTCYYEGYFVNDMREGKGQFHSSEGYYDGNFKNDQFEGKGEFHYSNGNRFVGEFSHGMKNGQGVFYYSNGSRLEATFENDSIKGKGKLWFANGEIREVDAKDFDVYKGKVEVIVVTYFQ